jgi:hypothetical protein
MHGPAAAAAPVRAKHVRRKRRERRAARRRAAQHPVGHGDLDDDVAVGARPQVATGPTFWFWKAPFARPWSQAHFGGQRPATMSVSKLLSMPPMAPSRLAHWCGGSGACSDTRAISTAKASRLLRVQLGALGLSVELAGLGTRARAARVQAACWGGAASGRGADHQGAELRAYRFIEISTAPGPTKGPAREAPPSHEPGQHERARRADQQGNEEPGAIGPRERERPAVRKGEWRARGAPMISGFGRSKPGGAGGDAHRYFAGLSQRENSNQLSLRQRPP